jgi:hypothetical protein
MNWIEKTIGCYWNIGYPRTNLDILDAANLFFEFVKKNRGKHEVCSNYEIFLAGVNYQKSLEKNQAAKNGN